MWTVSLGLTKTTEVDTLEKGVEWAVDQAERMDEEAAMEQTLHLEHRGWSCEIPPGWLSGGEPYPVVLSACRRSFGLPLTHPLHTAAPRQTDRTQYAGIVDYIKRRYPKDWSGLMEVVTTGVDPVVVISAWAQDILAVPFSPIVAQFRPVDPGALAELFLNLEMDPRVKKVALIPAQPFGPRS